MADRKRGVHDRLLGAVVVHLLDGGALFGITRVARRQHIYRRFGVSCRHLLGSCLDWSGDCDPCVDRHGSAARRPMAQDSDLGRQDDRPRGLAVDVADADSGVPVRPFDSPVHVLTCEVDGSMPTLTAGPVSLCGGRTVGRRPISQGASHIQAIADALDR